MFPMSETYVVCMSVDTPVWKKPFEVRARLPTVSTNEQITPVTGINQMKFVGSRETRDHFIPPCRVLSRFVCVFSIVIRASTNPGVARTISSWMTEYKENRRYSSIFRCYRALVVRLQAQ